MKSKAILPLTLIFAGVVLMSVQLYRYSIDSSLQNWHSNFSGFIQANLEQKKTKKPLLLFFYTDWCPNCRKLRENVLSQNDVNQYLENLIPVKINPETGKLENQISNEFKVMGYPTILMILPSEKVLNIRGLSNITPEKFITRLNEAINS
ncbi:MAG: thioredoxin family protein [Gammaproteobacteria bacterium]|nr:thioredoxin family protein [Gammaproteobacteria bacterium]